MKITLTKVHHVASLSEETECFDAVVLLDGVPAFRASNRGTGGMTDFENLPKQTREEFTANVKRLEDFAASLPEDTSLGDEHSFQPTADYLVDGALTDWLHAKDYRRMASSKFVLIDGGKVYTLKARAKPSALTAEQARATGIAIQKKFPTAELLNFLPQEVAIEKYIATVEES